MFKNTHACSFLYYCNALLYQEPSELELSDRDTEPVQLTFRSTVPIVCDPDYPFRCTLTIVVKTPHEVIGGLETGGACDVSITEDNWIPDEAVAYTNQTFLVAALRIRDVPGSGVVSNGITFLPFSYNHIPFWNSYQVESVLVSTTRLFNFKQNKWK